jgi:DNA double-strand break repair helicase HerA and related ATPase
MSTKTELIIGGANGQLIKQLGKLSNRHGMIAGATGTGKTVTLQILAEGFSRMGVPVFAADIKGDLSGLATEGTPHVKIDERLAEMPIKDYTLSGNPVVFWDIFGKKGHPVRTTISEMGPLLLSNLLELNDTQTGILYACFNIADDEGLLLLDLKDLRSMLSWMANNASELSSSYGNISKTSVAAIQRRLLVLEQQGAKKFFGEPALELRDLMQRDDNGHGVINILDATKLSSQSPHLYATFLLWLLSELFEQLPEVGDAKKPKLVFFFDEAHLLFDRAPRPLIDKIEQVVRLIRSKGVGIYFISQNPTDIPEDILGQLGLRIQHALRAFTPKDKKVVKTVAETFRPNPKFDCKQVITELGTGEALVSVLDEKGSPTPVERTLIRPPQSRIGPLKAAERTEVIENSIIGDSYSEAIDRNSAHEILEKRAKKTAQKVEKQQALKATKRAEPRKSNRQGIGEAMMKSVARSMGSALGRKIIRGILGSMFGKK